MDQTLTALLYSGGAIGALFLLLKIFQELRKMLDKKRNGNSPQQAVQIAESSRIFKLLEKSDEILEALAQSAVKNVENTTRLIELAETTNDRLTIIDAHIIRATDRQVTPQLLSDVERRLSERIDRRRGGQ